MAEGKLEMETGKNNNERVHLSNKVCMFHGLAQTQQLYRFSLVFEVSQALKSSLRSLKARRRVQIQ